ncbi:MAG TPA: PDC sensor domain-containing protein [Nitrososphaeraceae archaeon]|nr:PDC sensor domain-containing protein [Nitrososphaeraceae archaeon]
MKEGFFQEFCEKITSLDPHIRFIGIADQHGRLLATKDRKGLKPLLNMQETEQYALTAATRQHTRIRWQQVLGKIDYSSSHYDKLLRATIPITDENNHLSHIIILTLDVETDDMHKIMMDKVVPLVRENASKFLMTTSGVQYD